jgi:hypothetical protein
VLRSVVHSVQLTLLLWLLLLLLHHGLLLGVAWVAWRARWRSSSTHSRVGCPCWPHGGVSCCLGARPLSHARVAAWLLLWGSTRVAAWLVLLRRSAKCARRALAGSLRCECACQTHEQ